MAREYDCTCLLKVGCLYVMALHPRGSEKGAIKIVALFQFR